MSRINQCFEQLKADGQTALIPYIAACDPELWVTVPILHAMVEAGANLLELCIPFLIRCRIGQLFKKHLKGH